MFHALSATARRKPLVAVSALLALILLAGGILWYSQPVTTASPSGVDTVAVEASISPDEGARRGTQILLGLARDAMRDGRLVAPAGSNAYEFYLSALQLDPGNRTAQEALRESFPIAAKQIEGTINKKQLEQARREIDLLREFDRNNFTLALLGGKLSAASNIVRKQHEAEAERIEQAHAARMAAGS